MPRNRVWLALDFASLLALTAYVLLGVPLTPFHADEATQIAMSRDFFIQFVDGDLARLRYESAQPLTAEMQLRLINGTVSKTLIGLSWWLAGGKQEQLSGDWDWGAGWDYNVSTGRYPSPELLAAARLPSALFTAAAVTLMFALGWLLGGRPAAYLAAALFALHPAILLNGRRAMMEGSLLFFALLILLAGIAFCRRPSWLGALMLGICGGCAIASKHTGAALVAGVFAGVGVLLVAQRMWRVWLLLAVAALLVLPTFVLLNPAWWGGDIVELLGTIARWRQELITEQAAALEGYQDFSAQVEGFLRMSFGMQPQYFEVAGWQDILPIQQQIAAYEASPWRGLGLGDAAAGSLLFMSLALLGASMLVFDARVALTTRLPLFFWAAICVAVTVVSPLPWQRYYLPAYPTLLLFAAYAPFGCSRAITRWKVPQRANASP